MLVVWWLVSSIHHKNQRKEGLVAKPKKMSIEHDAKAKKETQRQGDFRDNSCCMRPPSLSPFAIVMKKWV
jgi:hypothetical protein